MPMLVTRTLTADQPGALRHVARIMGGMRADIWHRFGALKGIGRSVPSIRPDIPKLYGLLPVDGTIRAETAKDVLNDIKAFEAAAKQKVRQAISRRAGDDKAEAKRLYGLLKRDLWEVNNFLHRQMRKHFRHGQARSGNQFVVRSDKFSTAVVDGKLSITIRIAAKHGEDITLFTTTNGDGVDLAGKNLRIVLREGFTEIHYAFDKGWVGLPAARLLASTRATARRWSTATGISMGASSAQSCRPTPTRFTSQARRAANCARLKKNIARLAGLPKPNATSGTISARNNRTGAAL